MKNITKCISNKMWKVDIMYCSS